MNKAAEGGAIYVNSNGSGSSGAFVRSCTFTQNTATSAGGAIRRSGSVLPMTVTNCIVSGNVGAGSVSNDIVSGGTITLTFSAVGTNSGFSFTGSGNLPFGANLKLLPLAMNGGPTPTIAFASDSPVLNAGSSAASTDQRGLPRTALGGVDIGALERQAGTVVLNASDSGDGSLRNIVAESSRVAGGETITFDPVFFATQKTIALTTGEIPITDALTLTGPGADRVTISGNNASRIFNIDIPVALTVSISGLTIANGKSTSAGAIYLRNDTLTLNNCALTNNTATSGDGGAVWVQATGTLNVTSTLMANNRAQFGGAISSFGNGGSITVNNSTLSGNTATQTGGAIYFYGDGGTGLVVRNSTVTNNSANNAGGIRMLNTTAALAVTSAIVSGNSASVAGTDIVSTPTVTLNTSAIGSSQGFSFTGSGNLPFGSDLKLRPLASNGGPTMTHAFDPGSPLLDKSTFNALAFDQRGLSRLVGAATDIGALERQASGFVLNANNSGAGSLRENVLEANRLAGPDAILFDPTFFNSAKTVTLTGGEILITDNINIGGLGPGTTVLSGNNTNRIFNAAPGVDAFFSQLAFTAGKASVGGAIFGDTGSSITLQNCTVFGNSASAGGGVNSAGSLILVETAISGNTASGNSGGAFARHLTVISSTLSANTAAAGAGGLAATESLHIEASTISGNTTTFGAGLVLTNGPGPFTIRNSTFSGNKATSSDGGAIALGFSGSEPFLGVLILQNSTLTANSASGGGAGIARRFGTGSIAIESSIVSGNIAAMAPDIKTAGLVTLNASAVGFAGGFNFTGSNNLPFGIDLKLDALANNGGPTFTHLPANNSPLINAGSNPAPTLTLDQRGLPRVVGAIDIGAVEVEAKNALVLGYVVNEGLTQRSRRTTIRVNFAAPIDSVTLAAPGGFQLVRTLATPLSIVGTVVRTGSIGNNGRILLSQTSGLVTSITLTFDNADGAASSAGVESGSLADGRWQLAIPSLYYNSPLNDVNLRRFFGDVDSNGTINADDFAEFGNAFGHTSINNPFDFDNNGTINADDFAEFGNRFGVTL